MEKCVFKVKSSTNVQQLAKGLRISLLEENKSVTLRAIGAGAVNQMYKSLAITRGYVAVNGKDLLVKPGFDEITDDENDEKRTVMIAELVLV